MEILFALTGKNKNGFDCLLLSVIDDIKFKTNDVKKSILVYYFEGVDFVRQFTKYEDLYEFIRKHENSLKKLKATTFATLDVLTQDLNQVYDSLEKFLEAYYNNIPYTFSLQFSLSSNVYNLIILETILGTFDGNKINVYLHRFKNTPLTDTLISLYIRETKLPRIDVSKFIVQPAIAKQEEDNNIFIATQKNQNQNNSNIATEQYNQNQYGNAIQEIKVLLNEFKQEILSAIQSAYTKRNLNKYQLSLIELIEQADINEQNYQLIYNAIKTVLNNSNKQSSSKNKSNNIFDELDELNLNDIV